MAKEGKVLEQKKLLQPLLGTPEGVHRGCTISFSTSIASALYPSDQPIPNLVFTSFGETNYLDGVGVKWVS